MTALGNPVLDKSVLGETLARLRGGSRRKVARQAGMPAGT